MMIDPSAIAAILLNEQEAEIFEDRIAVDPVRKLSAAGLAKLDGAPLMFKRDVFALTDVAPA